MASYHINLLINKPVEHTYRHYLDENFMAKWISGFKGIELLRGEPRESDSYYKMIVRFHDEDLTVFQKLIDVEENERLLIEMEMPQLITRTEVLFQPEGKSTRMDVKVKLRGKTLKVKLAISYARALLLSRNQWDYMTFKQAVEKSGFEKRNPPIRRISGL